MDDYALNAIDAAPEPQAHQPYVPQQPPFQQPQQPQQQAPQQPQPEPVPFTQADSLTLQKLNQHLSSIQNSVFEGTLTQEQGQELEQQVLSRQKPLLAKQQAHQQKQQKEANQAAMQQTAQGEAIRGTHQKLRAQQFPQSVATFIDPATGAAAHFIQDEKGNWDEIEFGRHEAQMDRVAETPDIPMAMGWQDSQVSGSTAPSPASQPPQEQGQTGQPMTLEELGQKMRQGGQQSPSNAPLPEIRNALGQNIDQRLIDEGVIKDPRRTMHPDTMKEFMRRAESMFPPLGPNAPEWMQKHRAEQVHHLFQAQVSNDLRMKDHAETRKSIQLQHELDKKSKAEESQRHEKAQAEENRLKHEERLALQREAANKEKKLSEKDEYSAIKGHLDDIRKESMGFEKGIKEKTITEEAIKNRPLYHSDPDLAMTEAMRREQDIKGAMLKARKEQPEGGPAKPKEQTGGLPREDAQRVSSIRPEKSAPLLENIKAGIAEISRDKKLEKDTPEKELYTHLEGMRDILTKAVEEKRPLTVGECAAYEQRHAQLDALMRKHGISAGAKGLRLYSPPPLAPQPGQAAQPAPRQPANDWGPVQPGPPPANDWR